MTVAPLSPSLPFAIEAARLGFANNEATAIAVDRVSVSTTGRQPRFQMPTPPTSTSLALFNQTNDELEKGRKQRMEWIVSRIRIWQTEGEVHRQYPWFNTLLTADVIQCHVGDVTLDAPKISYQKCAREHSNTLKSSYAKEGIPSKTTEYLVDSMRRNKWIQISTAETPDAFHFEASWEATERYRTALRKY